jgi:type IV secretory pathway VirB10-like protein
MKRFNPNEIHAGGARESNIRPSLSIKPNQRHYTKGIAAIFAVIILHFVSQFIFLQSEKTALETEAINHQSVEIKPESEPAREIETESAATETETVTRPSAVQPVVQPEPKIEPARVVIKKKEPRESRTERLRRAERLLTGV